MSCDFDLKCTQCGSSTDLDLNHGGDALAQILEHRATLEAFGLLEKAVRSNGGPYLGEDDRGPLIHVALFLVEHVGHPVVVEDEYGRIHGRCASEVRCECGARHWCRFDAGHEGEHAR